MSARFPDYLVVGGGIVGLTVASELRRREPGAEVHLLEKEPSLGLHASGRNSGVLHAGFYYTADSLKARFSRDGNRELTEYCLERGLKINRCGKLVVARSEAEWERMEELFRRGATNGVDVRRVDEAEAAELDPTVRTVGGALHSPTTSTVDPAEVVSSLGTDAREAGVKLRPGVRYLGRRGDAIRTTEGDVSAGYVVNAAGLYADRIARDYGFGEHYRILPFKGLYLYYQGSGPAPRMHVYPVPPLDYPFLGVHWTSTVDGGTKLGPTAIPAFWREHYTGLGGFRLGELLEIGLRESELWLRDSFGFRRLALVEMRKYSRRHLVDLGRELVQPSVGSGRWRWGRPGVRAQLLDTRHRRLEMDFRYEGDDRSFHVLNAVSPAFTCALPFARHVVDEIERRLGGDVAAGDGSGIAVKAQA